MPMQLLESSDKLFQTRVDFTTMHRTENAFLRKDFWTAIVLSNINVLHSTFFRGQVHGRPLIFVFVIYISAGLHQGYGNV